MKGLSIVITCRQCGQPHRIPLDDSGHYSGPLPCDRTQHADLQCEPQGWRRFIEQEQAKVQH